jgi:hypothetical protein
MEPRTPCDENALLELKLAGKRHTRTCSSNEANAKAQCHEKCEQGQGKFSRHAASRKELIIR